MSVVSESHIRAFGAIIYNSASVEWGIRCMFAGVLETPLVEALIVTEPYSASQLKNAVKSAVKLSRLTEESKEKFIHILGEWGSFSTIRNQVAHCRWESGKRSNSISPVVINIRHGKAELGTKNNRDWLPEELAMEADKLAKLNEKAQLFFRESGIADFIEKKDLERMEEEQGAT